MVNVAVVGLGHWGPNLARNMSSLFDVTVAVLCDADTRRAEAVRQRFVPQARIVTDYRAVAADPTIDAVLVATPIRSHYDIGSTLLAAGKHVFIEKPLARTVEECLGLIEAAERNRRVLMVGHVFEYNASVRRIKEYVDRGELGRLLYMYSQRVNLGRIQHDVNAMWSFAPHDISIINYWLGEEPARVTARGFSCLNTGIEDVVFATIEYPSGIGAHLHLGWLDPRKVRQMTLVGSKKMLVYDDVSLDAKIQIYDKGVVRPERGLDAPQSFAEFQLQLRVGDITIPTLQFNEPLHTECRHFVDCITTGAPPLTDGWNGLRVVRVLEAAEQSIKQGGRAVEIEEREDEVRVPMSERHG
jgi:predicted dehydrogenase